MGSKRQLFEFFGVLREKDEDEPTFGKHLGNTGIFGSRKGKSSLDDDPRFWSVGKQGPPAPSRRAATTGLGTAMLQRGGSGDVPIHTGPARDIDSIDIPQQEPYNPEGQRQLDVDKLKAGIDSSALDVLKNVQPQYPGKFIGQSVTFAGKFISKPVVYGMYNMGNMSHQRKIEWERYQKNPQLGERFWNVGELTGKPEYLRKFGRIFRNEKVTWIWDGDKWLLKNEFEKKFSKAKEMPKAGPSMRPHSSVEDLIGDDEVPDDLKVDKTDASGNTEEIPLSNPTKDERAGMHGKTQVVKMSDGEETLVVWNDKVDSGKKFSDGSPMVGAWQSPKQFKDWTAKQKHGSVHPAVYKTASQREKDAIDRAHADKTGRYGDSGTIVNPSEPAKRTEEMMPDGQKKITTTKKITRTYTKGDMKKVRDNKEYNIKLTNGEKIKLKRSGEEDAYDVINDEEGKEKGKKIGTFRPTKSTFRQFDGGECEMTYTQQSVFYQSAENPSEDKPAEEGEKAKKESIERPVDRHGPWARCVTIR